MDYVAKAENFPFLQPLIEGPLQLLRQPHRSRDGNLFKIACSFLRAGTFQSRPKVQFRQLRTFDLLTSQRLDSSHNNMAIRTPHRRCEN
jgi:hypothetical protein